MTERARGRNAALMQQGEAANPDGARKPTRQRSQEKSPDGAVETPPPTAEQYEAWLAEVKGLYGKTNETMLAVARWFKAKRDQIGQHFEPFIDGYIDTPTGLGWSRSQVYRMIAALDTWDGNEHLDRFDRSALYSLSSRRPSRGNPTQEQKAQAKKVQKAREACLKRAAAGEYITNKIALKALVKAGAVTVKATSTSTSTSRSLTVEMSDWNARAKDRGLDPEKVMAMLKDLDIVVHWSEATAGPKKEGTA